MRLDALIFGGGASGLWLLDALRRQQQRAVLVETNALGAGQTVASQGILHGGTKYALDGWLRRSARAIRDMPSVWRDCLAGRSAPDLRSVRLRAESCFLWRSDRLRSRLAMWGARFGLRVAPQQTREEERPPVLRGCPGMVARLAEQVIAPRSLIAELAAPHRDWILKLDGLDDVRFDCSGPGEVRSVRIHSPCGAHHVDLYPRWVCLTAGAGNAALRQMLGLPAEAMQRRPLHMVLARGPLPTLCGHCVDGAQTRVTITTDLDAQGRTVWQIGGQIAEDGVAMRPQALVEHARREIAAVLPGIDLQDVAWSTYRVDRAEGATLSGRRPDSFRLLCEGRCLTAWPTKLVLVPALAAEMAELVGTSALRDDCPAEVFQHWPTPDVAQPPWERVSEWYELGGRPHSGVEAQRAA